MEGETIILRPKKLKMITLLFTSLIFVIGSFTFIDEEPLLGWSSITFFGLGVIVFAISLIPNSTYLKLTHDGFEIRSLYKLHHTKWEDVKSFRAGSITTPIITSIGTFLSTKKKMVFFDYVESYKKHKMGKAFSKAISGNHAALPDLYGMKVEDLAKLMNNWKNKNSVQHK